MPLRDHFHRPVSVVARRILLLITDLEIGGTPTVVRELAVRLREPANAEMEVACLKRWGPVADQLRDAGVHVTAFGARSAHELPGTVRQLRRLVREREIDTVFSFLVHANTVAALASRKLSGVRFLQSIQTVQPKPKWHWWLQRRVQRFADRVIVPSTAVAQVARERCGIAPGRIVVIPNAIDPAEYPRVEPFRDPAKVRAGYLGRLDPAKSPGALIGAIADANLDRAELHYYGDGPARLDLERSAARAGVAGRVFFHGTVARPPDALRHMDVLWLPSRVEGFGLVLIEAMASGVPVVACEAGGVTDVIRHGENGLLVSHPANDARDFAASLRTLRDDVALREKLIAGGLRTVREKFTWDVVLPQYRTLLAVTDEATPAADTVARTR
jgi:glycosyltransferase involved in cell wall biosynthesis